NREIGVGNATRFAVFVSGCVGLGAAAFVGIQGWSFAANPLLVLGAILVPCETLYNIMWPQYVVTDSVTIRNVYDIGGSIIAVILTFVLATGSHGDEVVGAAVAFVIGRWVSAGGFVAH